MRKISQIQVLTWAPPSDRVLAVTEDGSFWMGVVPPKAGDPVEWTPLNTPPERMPPLPGHKPKTRVPGNMVVGKNVDPDRVAAVQGEELATPPQGVRGTSS